MPTSGSIINFDQSLPIFADKQAVSNLFKQANINQLTNDVGAVKLYLSCN